MLPVTRWAWRASGLAGAALVCKARGVAPPAVAGGLGLLVSVAVAGTALPALSTILTDSRQDS